MSLFLSTELLLLLVAVALGLVVSYMIFREINAKFVLMIIGIFLLMLSLSGSIGSYGLALFALCFSVSIYMTIQDKRGNN